MKPTRRSFLIQTGTVIGGATVGPTLLGIQSRTGAEPAPPLPTVPEIRAVDGVLSTTMRMAPANVDLGPQAGERRRVRVETYQVGDHPAGIPGATLRMKQGDRLEVLLRNDMQPLGLPTNGQLPPGYGEPPEPGKPSLAEKQIFTNLHTHGFQVSPKDPGDNVLLIDDGAVF